MIPVLVFGLRPLPKLLRRISGIKNDFQRLARKTRLPEANKDRPQK